MENQADAQGTGSTWVGNLTSILGAAVPIVNAVKGGNGGDKAKPATPAATANPNTKLYVIGGIVVLVLVGLLFFLRRK